MSSRVPFTTVHTVHVSTAYQGKPWALRPVADTTSASTLKLDLNLDLKSLWSSSSASLKTSTKPFDRSSWSSEFSTDPTISGTPSPLPATESNTELASRMPKENIHDFDAYPWYTRLLADPLTHEVPFEPRTITRNSTINSLFNRTLATNGTLRACQAFQRQVKASASDPSPSTQSPTQTEQDGHIWKDGVRIEAILVASLGGDLDGHAGLAHGGIIGTLFDESLALAALQILPRVFMTAKMEVVFKKAVPTPGVVVVVSEVVRWEGRKAWVSGSMEDGEGDVYAVAECLYVIPKEKESKM